MASEVPIKETGEHQIVAEQERPAVEEPPAVSESELIEETAPSGIPAAAPPIPPNGRLAASIQHMPLALRWVLGLALAFMSGFVIVTLGNISLTATAFAVAIMVVLALAAGYVLSSWWSFLALAIASAFGAGLGSWVAMQMSPSGAFKGLTGMDAVLLLLFFYALLDLGPLILFLLAGIGIGKQQGITLATPHALSAREASVSRWISGLSLVIAGEYLIQFQGQLPGLILHEGPVLDYLPAFPFAVMIAVTCLLAGWLLRSWWGCVVVSIVYIGGAALGLLPYIGFSFLSTLVVGSVLFIVLPAVAMSIIGTVIGKQRARRKEQV